MGQTRWSSFMESCLNIAVGFGVALVSQLVIFPMYGIHVPLSVDIYITLWFTLISLVRSYALRRFFNYRMTRK